MRVCVLMWNVRPLNLYFMKQNSHRERHTHTHHLCFIKMPNFMLCNFAVMYDTIWGGCLYKSHVVTLFSPPPSPHFFSLCVSLCRQSSSVYIHRRCWNWVTMCPFFSCSQPQTTSALPQDRITLTPCTQDSLTSLFRCLNSVYYLASPRNINPVAL